MNYKRMGRLLVCLVLICALLINVSPIKASAVIVPQLGMYPEEIVVRSVVHALGLYSDENPEFFDGLCNGIRELWYSAGYVVNGFVQLFNFFNSPFIRQDLVELARNYLYDSGAITTAPYELEIEGYRFVSNGPLLTLTSQYYKAGSGDKYYRYVHVYSSESFNVVPTGISSSTFTVDGVQYMCRTVKLTEEFLYDESLPTGSSSSVVEKYITSNGFQDTVYADGLQVQYVGPQHLELPEAYPEWVPQQLQDEVSGLTQVYFPLGLGQTQELTDTLTQEQIWAGEILGELDQIQLTQVTQGFLQQLLQHPIQTLGRILEELISIPGKILGGLGQILIDVLTYLFVPAQDFLQLKIQALVQEFGYLDPVIALGDTFKAYFTGVNPTPPVIWIDLGASAWYPMGGRVKFIDLTWYAQYKPTVDGIIGAFLWLWLLWRLFQSAPGIVRGASGMFGKPDSHPDSSFSTHSE